MRLLFDQNLSPRLVHALAGDYPDCEHVRALGLSKASDEEVWLVARRDGWLIASKDDDFRQLSVVRGAPPKVIGLLIGNCSTGKVIELLRRNAELLGAFASDLDAAYLPLHR